MSRKLPLRIALQGYPEHFATGREIEAGAGGAFLTGASGHEHHFGGVELGLSGSEHYLHAEYVATYVDDSATATFDPRSALDDLREGFEIAPAPNLGPRLATFVLGAVDDMAESCNFGNGFVFDFEKREAVLTFLALARCGEKFSIAELEVWATTRGWSLKDAKALRELAQRVREGRSFRPAIRLSEDQYRRFLEHWRNSCLRPAA